MRYSPAFAFMATILICGLCVQPVLAESAEEWVNSGNQFNQQGRYQEALQAFENAINLDAGNKYAWTGKCGALLGLGRYEDALSAADFAQTLDQSDPSFMEIVLQVKGNALKSLNRNQEALDAFDKALAINANNGFTWVLKSDTLNQMGRANEALQSAEKALEIDPTSTEAWTSKGSALMSLNRLQESLDAFNKALAIDSGNPWSWNGKSNILNQMGRPAEALFAAEQALAIDSGRADFWNSKGLSLLALGRNQDSLDAYNQALAIDSGNQWSWNMKSNVLNQLGRSAEALTAAENALAIDSGNADFWCTKGSALQSLNRLPESLDAYNQALSIDSGYKWSWIGKINVLNQMRRYSEALSVIEQALAIDPTDADFWNSKGDALLFLGRYQESLDAYNMAIDSGNPGSWCGKINVFITMGRYAEAISAAEHALAIDPTNANFWNGKGSALQSLNRLPESLDAYNQALVIDSGNPWAWSGKSNVLNQMGRPDEALSAAEHALALDSGRTDFWNSKGYALISLGRYQESLDAFNRALAIDATNPNSQNGRQEAVSKIGDDPGSTISATPVPTPLSVTAVSTPKIQSTSPSPSPSNSGDSNLTSAAPTPGIEGTPLSLSSSYSIYPNLSLPIIVILAVFFLAGGGYVIHRIKKKPSGYKPPERKEKKAIAPPPTPAGLLTKPELTVTLDRTRLIADDWDRMTIQLANRGNAHARDVRLTFSEEFDTKWIKPAMINGGATTSLDIAIRPKVKGKIPLEVTAQYRDVYGKEYRETHEFWIDVVEKETTTSPPSETPSSPVGLFSPKPLAPKQLPPDLSDRYTESEFIGKGGFARVFKAKRKDGKYVAVKIPISLDAMTGKSFIAEMQNWTKLSHPNIVRLYDFNIMPMPFFEEELCDGALSDKEKPVESEAAAWILFNICEGLKFAHKHKIIHRDLKPQNILLKEGVPKISDWGLSRVISESTTTTATSFTPHYAAPEQIHGRVKDERTDIWQIGVILYELVTGILPFKGDSMVEIGMNIATKDPTRPGEIIPEAKAMDDIIMKCLQKDPNKRYQSVLELQKDLAIFLRKNYTELLKMSVTAHDNNRSAYYCGDLVMINILTGDIPTSYKYLLDLIHYSKGDVTAQAQELSEQLKMRMEMGIIEIPDELIRKAEIIVHRVIAGFRNNE